MASRSAAKGGLSAWDVFERGGYAVVVKRGDQQEKIVSAVPKEMAVLMCDVLTIKKALDSGADLGGLHLLSRHPQRRMDLLQDGAGGPCAAEACGIFYHEIVAQLKRCAEGGSLTPSPSDGTAVDGPLAAADMLLSAAVFRRCNAVAALVVAAAFSAAAAESGWDSMLERALEAVEVHGADSALVELLLAALPDPAAAVGAIIETQLHRSLLDNSSGVAQLLLAAAPEAALIIDEDNLDQNALHLASLEGNLEAARRLLAAAPAAAEAEDALGSTSAHLAAHGGHAGVLRLLLAAAPDTATAKNETGWTPLHMAAGSGHLEATAALLDCSAEAAAERLNALNHGGCTPAWLAANGGHSDVLQLLLTAAPATASMPDADGLLPIHAAAFGGSTSCIQALLTLAPEAANSTDEAGATPLYFAARYGHPEAARFLLAAAPDTASAIANDDDTPLHAAAWEGHTAVAELLVAAAPEVMQQANEEGLLPIHQAAARGHLGVLRLLMSAAPGSVLAQTYDGLNGHAEAVSVLLAVAPEAASRTCLDGRTPLHAACMFINDTSKLPAVARALLPFGPSTAVLRSLVNACIAGRTLFPLLAEFVTCHLPLSSEDWYMMLDECPGLGRALPAALAHSPDQASMLVLHLPPADAERLRLSALCLHRAQRTRHISLPQPLVWHILSLLFDA